MTREQQLNADMDQFSADIAEFQVASGIPHRTLREGVILVALQRIIDRRRQQHRRHAHLSTIMTKMVMRRLTREIGKRAA